MSYTRDGLDDMLKNDEFLNPPPSSPLLPLSFNTIDCTSAAFTTNNHPISNISNEPEKEASKKNTKNTASKRKRNSKSSHLDTDLILTEEQIKKRKKNRENTRNYRARKKEMIDGLTEANRNLILENEKLTLEVGSLKNQIQLQQINFYQYINNLNTVNLPQSMQSGPTCANYYPALFQPASNSGNTNVTTTTTLSTTSQVHYLNSNLSNK